jgi:exodeoxyribonuclease III
MRILSYNILYGGQDRHGSRLPKILDAISHINADCALIQEANRFDENLFSILGSSARALGFDHAAMSAADDIDGLGGYSVATFSRNEFRAIDTFHGKFRNAALQTVIDTDLGQISICNIHLTPGSEDDRLRELAVVLDAQRKYDFKIIAGDFNSLSPEDHYDADMIAQFNQTQKRKFTRTNRLRVEVISRVLDEGMIDVARALGKSHELTVPTKMAVDAAHKTPLRIDYVFASQKLVPYIGQFGVEKNALTDHASDHYPIVFEIKI